MHKPLQLSRNGSSRPIFWRGTQLRSSILGSSRWSAWCHATHTMWVNERSTQQMSKYVIGFIPLRTADGIRYIVETRGSYIRRSSAPLVVGTLWTCCHSCCRPVAESLRSTRAWGVDQAFSHQMGSLDLYQYDGCSAFLTLMIAFWALLGDFLFISSVVVERPLFQNATPPLLLLLPL